MDIEIQIHRPFLLLLILGGFGWFVYWAVSAHPQASAEAPVGGSGQSQAEVAMEAEESVRSIREQQAVLSKREGILRAQLELLLEEKLDAGNDPALLDQITTATHKLVDLLADQRAADEALKGSLRDLWEAEGNAMQYSRSQTTSDSISLEWPVTPALGISAHFHDASYKKRFGMEHNAIDIPVAQNSDVHAAADGIVAKVSDKGMGFNSLIIQHANGYATLYGHVTKFLVSEGEHVRAGDIVALSGGRPGTPGAGLFTTGSHLHFELHQNGTPIDPQQFLNMSELLSQ